MDGESGSPGAAHDSIAVAHLLEGGLSPTTHSPSRWGARERSAVHWMTSSVRTAASGISSSDVGWSRSNEATVSLGGSGTDQVADTTHPGGRAGGSDSCCARSRSSERSTSRPSAAPISFARFASPMAVYGGPDSARVRSVLDEAGVRSECSVRFRPIGGTSVAKPRNGVGQRSGDWSGYLVQGADGHVNRVWPLLQVLTLCCHSLAL